MNRRRRGATSRPPASRLFGLAIALALASGCVSALRKPPTIEQLAGGAVSARPEAAGPLLREAERLFALRDSDSVNRAATRWLEAAAADPESIEGLLGAIRAHVWLTSDPNSNIDARLRSATAAVQAAQLCGQRAPGDVTCDYWLAVSIGVQARERRWTALDALARMVVLLERVIAVAPEMDRGGPHRVLALVLTRAPGWPTGPGDPEYGLEHARSAVAIDPEYPPNQLALGEVLRVNGEDDGSREAYLRALDRAGALRDAGDRDALVWIAEARQALGGS